MYTLNAGAPIDRDTSVTLGTGAGPCRDLNTRTKTDSNNTRPIKISNTFLPFIIGDYLSAQTPLEAKLNRFVPSAPASGKRQLFSTPSSSEGSEAQPGVTVAPLRTSPTAYPADQESEIL